MHFKETVSILSLKYELNQINKTKDWALVHERELSVF